MGAVYEASHLRIPKKFAIKFLKVSLLDNPVALLRFRREAEVIATLDHPAIVSLLDYNITADGVPYTILEYLEGEHLGDLVNRGRLPLTEALRITGSVVGALAAAHAKGIVHRDLKPENVIICRTGAVKVVDFGIAKLRGGQELTAFNSILGTITYMAPEQLMAGQIDARADQFALGAIAYEMLSGDMPFGSEGSIPEIAERVLRQQPPPLTGYPRAVFDVILRAMAKEAAQRYPSVDAFFSALKEATQPVLEAAARAAPPAPIAAAKPTAQAIAERPTIPPGPAVQLPTPPPPAPSFGSEHTVDEGLPEMAGETTAISNAPTVVAPAPGDPGATGVEAKQDKGETEQPAETDQPAETTRITRTRHATAEVSSTETIRPGVLQQVRRTERTTGGMSTPSGSTKIGRRGGIVVGVVIGVLVAIAASLLAR